MRSKVRSSCVPTAGWNSKLSASPLPNLRSPRRSRRTGANSVGCSPPVGGEDRKGVNLRHAELPIRATSVRRKPTRSLAPFVTDTRVTPMAGRREAFVLFRQSVAVIPVIDCLPACHGPSPLASSIRNTDLPERGQAIPIPMSRSGVCGLAIAGWVVPSVGGAGSTAASAAHAGSSGVFCSSRIALA